MQQIVKLKLDSFFSPYPIVHFNKGDTIIAATDKIEYIYYLTHGLVRQSFITPDGEDITHHIFKPVSYFPIMLVLSKMPNNYFFTAVEPLTLKKAPTQEVLNFLHNEQDVLFDLTERFAEGLSKLLLKNENMLFKDAYTKVASLLIYLGEKFGTKEHNETVISLPITHADLSSWLGMQRETVSRQIKKLQDNGCIRYTDNLLTIINPEKLMREVGE